MYYFDSHIQYCSNVKYNSTTFAVAGSQSEREANGSLTNHIPRLLNFEKKGLFATKALDFTLL